MSDDIVARLRGIEGGYNLRNLFHQAADEIERLREERDSARAEVCYLRPSVALGVQSAADYAVSRGWTCFADKEVDG